MPYTTKQRIADAITMAQLLQITDDTKQNAVGDTFVNAAIVDADTLIDTYLAGRYAIPVAAPVPDVLATVSTNLAIYNLYLRRFGTDEDGMKVARNRYNDALDLLKRINAGQITLSIATPTAPASGSMIGATNVRERIFPKTRLDRM